MGALSSPCKRFWWSIDEARIVPVARHNIADINEMAVDWQNMNGVKVSQGSYLIYSLVGVMLHKTIILRTQTGIVKHIVSHLPL